MPDDDDFDIEDVIPEAAWAINPEQWTIQDTLAIAFTLGHDLFGSVAQAFVNLRNCALADDMWRRQARSFHEQVARDIEALTEVQDG
jgi:uncharacterized protein YxjI